MLVVLSTQTPSQLRIGQDGVPLRFFGTDYEIASLLYREDGRTISRKTVRAWRQGKSKIPDWAQAQLSNIYWRKIILNNDLIQYGQSRCPPNPEMSPDVVRGQEGLLLNPIYWKRTRRDGKPMYVPGSATIPAARNFALMNGPGRILRCGAGRIRN